MSGLFCIIGEREKSDEKALEVIQESGLEALHLSPTASVIYDLHDIAPVGVLVESSVRNRRTVVDHLKAQEAMVSVPIIAQLAKPDPELVGAAFQDGVDEYLVDGSYTQLAMISDVLQKRTIESVKQNAGTVLVADPNRQTRVRFAHALKRGGFDVHFAADCLELENSIEKVAPRAIIATPNLPGGSFAGILESVAAKGKDGRPWIVVSSRFDRNAFASMIVQPGPISFVEDNDAVENISFKLNELLNPVPPGRRSSRRLLYSTPAHFEYGEDLGTFYGYSYNVNLNGLFIRTLTPPCYGTELDLKFSPPFGKGYVSVKAQVTWRSDVAERTGKITPPGMGVQFLEWDLADWAGFEAGYSALLAENNYSRPVDWNRSPSIMPVSLSSDRSPTYQPAHP